MNLRKIIREELKQKPINESQDEWAWAAEIPTLEKGRIYSVKKENIEEFLYQVESIYPEFKWTTSRKKPSGLIDTLKLYERVYIYLYLNNEIAYSSEEIYHGEPLTSHEPMEYK
jgi:hypothetical protein